MGMIRQNQNAGVFMCKPEPKIAANGLTNEEVYQWMRQKIAAVSQLKEALAEREDMLQALKRLDDKIALLSSKSAVEFSDKESDPIPSR